MQNDIVAEGGDMSEMPIELLVSREWNGTKWHYPNIERLLEENGKLRALVKACLAEGVSGMVRDDGTISLSDHGCGCCSGEPLNLTEEQLAMIEVLLKESK